MTVRNVPRRRRFWRRAAPHPIPPLPPPQRAFRAFSRSARANALSSASTQYAALASEHAARKLPTTLDTQTEDAGQQQAHDSPNEIVEEAEDVFTRLETPLPEMKTFPQNANDILAALAAEALTNMDNDEYPEDSHAQTTRDEFLPAPTEDFVEALAEGDENPEEVGMLPPRLVPQPVMDNEDGDDGDDKDGEGAEDIPHHRNAVLLDDFTMALGIWCEDANVTRSGYIGLLQVLRSLSDLGRLKVLPETLDTLRIKTRAQLPLLRLQAKRIPVVMEKQPSLPSRAKNKPATTLRKMVFFDPIDMVRRMVLASAFVERLHFGMADLVDVPTELYHSESWGSSIRTCSGNFARYPDGAPIFLSDIVEYRCQLQSHCLNSSYKHIQHIGRVTFVGRDRRRMTKMPGAKTLVLQQLICGNEVPIPCYHLLTGSDEADQNELFLLEDVTATIHELEVLYRRPDVHLQWGNNALPDLPDLDQDSMFVRRIINTQYTSIRPLNLSPPLRADLEIKEYRRDQLTAMFDNRESLCMPMMTFIDGFGLYRNSYRSLMGIYQIPAGLCAKDRNRRANVFVSTLGPHGAKFEDVIAALWPSWSRLDRGISMDINGRQVLVCAFTHAFLGDMPQQLENRGLLRQNANHGCGYCLVHAKERGNLDYDTVKNGRYHYQVLDTRRRGEAMTASARKKFFGDVGMRDLQTPLISIAPALDIVRSRPANVAHSEYRGLGKISQELLFTAILTPAAQSQYTSEFQRFPFPPGWARIQSPKRHLKVWSMSEAGRAVIVTPVLLRFWLRPRHMQPKYRLAIEREFASEMAELRLQAKDMVVRCFALLAKSASLVGRLSLTADDRNEIGPKIREARRALQRLLECARQGQRGQGRQDGQLRTTPVTRRNLDLGIPSRSVSPSDANSARTLDSAASESGGSSIPDPHENHEESVGSVGHTAFSRLQSRPNMHIGLHYEDVAKEYGSPYNTTTFIGEDTHRSFKKDADNGNALNVEEILLTKQNVRLTTRLLLDGGYTSLEQGLTDQLQRLRRCCPDLVLTRLSGSERRLPQESHLSISSDSEHRAATASHRLNKTWLDQTSLPTNLKLLTLMDPFCIKLRHAYNEDYAVRNVVRFGGKLLFYMKLSFTDRLSERRVTLNLGDFVLVRDALLARLDHIFVHQLEPGQKRAFAMLTMVETTGPLGLDEVLKLPLRRLSSHQKIVGLPGLMGTMVWAISASRKRGQAGFNCLSREGDLVLHCVWDINFL
ncbi:MAG: hypothetical protein M1837_006343 [Sclerophora amabilis]|nr:MAG: hypothetical protein M1837_006343 [Sclerophora amabilis]